MNKAILISVRTGSTRLPNKSILKIKNKYTVEYVINSVKKSKYADKIVLCTTQLKEDDILCRIANENNIKFHRGSTNNKWHRWFGALIEFDIDSFVTADGDDLFYDAGLADLCFEKLEKNDFVNGQGLYNDVYGITKSTLEWIVKMKNIESIEPHQIVNNIENTFFKIHKLKDVDEIYNKKNIRMTLDYEEDFKFFKKVIESLKDDFSLQDVLDYLENNPEVIDINVEKEKDWKINQGTM